MLGSPTFSPPPQQQSERRHLLSETATNLSNHVLRYGHSSLEKSEGLYHNFKSFLNDSNSTDLAIGLIVGGAFGKVVTSFSTDLLLPPIGLLTVLEGVNLQNLFFVLHYPSDKPQRVYPTPEVAQEDGAVTWNYGRFVSNLIEFLLIAISLFIIIQFLQIVRLGKIYKEKKKCPYCLDKVKIMASKCKSCGSELEVPPSSPS
ncbi:MAG: large-conductance mechanosensitive channel [Piptocephalis tieghemiana]|nr:MAG: large-conductance mechanosensitive channel [Piptocephalis tieghemiana]